MELKGQINAIEDAKKQSPASAIIEATYSEPAVAQPAAPPAKPQNSQGESTFEIYGFVMLDAGYQFKQNDSAWFDVVRPTKLPSFPNEFAPNGNSYFSVRQSRLGVKSSTPTKWSTSVGYSMMDVDNSNGQAADAYRRGHYASGNLLYYPWDNVLMGGEFIWGRRENFLDGFKSDDFRIQFPLNTTFQNHSSSDFEN